VAGVEAERFVEPAARLCEISAARGDVAEQHQRVDGLRHLIDREVELARGAVRQRVVDDRH